MGGISTGQQIRVNVALKPTSSIPQERRSIDKHGNAVLMQTTGRHDPCVGVRATPIVEAMLAMVLMDHALRNRKSRMRMLIAAHQKYSSKKYFSIFSIFK